MSEGKKSVRDFCDNPRSNPRSVRWSIPQPEVKRLGDANYEMVVVAKNLADLMPKTPDQNLRGELQAQINRLLDIATQIDGSLRSAIYVNDAG